MPQQQTTTVLDPNSGKISTIITPTIDAPSLQTSPAKKPSYLNLACCVNGYSNLTTYDSKLRQNINKSREVSPIRPITHTVQYNRGDSNYLVVPVTVPINDNNTIKSYVMESHTILSPEKRYFTSPSATGRDVSDNVNAVNGSTNFFKKSVFNATNSTIGHHHTLHKNGHEPEVGVGGGQKTSTKSFIQQRVERLYGPGALAKGLYSPKKPKRPEDVAGTVLAEKSQN